MSHLLVSSNFALCNFKCTFFKCLERCKSRRSNYLFKYAIRFKAVLQVASKRIKVLFFVQSKFDPNKKANIFLSQFVAIISEKCLKIEDANYRPENKENGESIVDLSSTDNNGASVVKAEATKPRLVDYDDEVRSAKDLEIKNIEYDFVALEKLKQLGKNLSCINFFWL